VRDKVGPRHFLCETNADLVAGESNCEFTLVGEGFAEEDGDEEAEDAVLTEECGNGPGFETLGGEQDEVIPFACDSVRMVISSEGFYGADLV